MWRQFGLYVLFLGLFDKVVNNQNKVVPTNILAISLLKLKKTVGEFRSIDIERLRAVNDVKFLWIRNELGE